MAKRTNTKIHVVVLPPVLSAVRLAQHNLRRYKKNDRIFETREAGKLPIMYGVPTGLTIQYLMHFLSTFFIVFLQDNGQNRCLSDAITN